MIKIPTKAYIAGAIIIVILLAGWFVAGVIEENGELNQANATLKKSVEDGEAERAKLKLVANANADAVNKAGKEKSVLNTYALKLAHELEILKHENAEIKKWSIGYLPSIITGRLLDCTDNDNKDGLSNSTKCAFSSNRRAANENLYNYAIDLRSALRSCNADKAGLREWYKDVGIIIE